MTNALDTSRLFITALSPALITAGIVSWRLTSNPVKLVGIQNSIVILVTIGVTMAAFIGGQAALRDNAPGSADGWQIALWIAAVLIGFGVGHVVASTLRKRQSRPTTG